ncbi:hypothetical protein CANARDRAFT_29032 [[Candida] arabinofermentans NRRL YB-2248]|uniref:tRNA-splicing endonuclease subunit Sen54 N-terminal domain-containing protein n=1 Tax=[Candida] arabinofermentans NRRL YB-2248 TaxID=983967 RepID=A0A1E4SYA4_9ASCO|nr:hypothetical protein CANARDRAFT_29032 [[Candida] arabinofermentans NRRL YB-2248]
MEVDPELAITYGNDDEDVQDWSLLSKFTQGTKSNNVPKRGEKDFEPVLKDDLQITDYDLSNLNSSRQLMYDALRSQRGLVSSLKNLKSSTIYINSLMGTYYMKKPKGKFLESIGKIDKNGTCWFNFEEVMYLVERGSCIGKLHQEPEIDDSLKPPLSLEKVYSIVLKNPEDYNQFQVYSMLKRTGYIVMRSQPTDYMTVSTPTRKTGVFSFFKKVLRLLQRWLFTTRYSAIFEYLQSLIAKDIRIDTTTQESKYKITYDVWKPNTKFKKTQPPVPDYQIVIVDAHEPFPTVKEIKSLLAISNTKPVTIKQSKKGVNINRLKFGGNDESKSVVFAVVDSGLINFYNLTGCDFAAEGTSWQDSWMKPRTGVSKRGKSRPRQNRKTK